MTFSGRCSSKQCIVILFVQVMRVPVYLGSQIGRVQRSLVLARFRYLVMEAQRHSALSKRAPLLDLLRVACRSICANCKSRNHNTTQHILMFSKWVIEISDRTHLTTRFLQWTQRVKRRMDMISGYCVIALCPPRPYLAYLGPLAVTMGAKRTGALNEPPASPL